MKMITLGIFIIIVGLILVVFGNISEDKLQASLTKQLTEVQANRDETGKKYLESEKNVIYWKGRTDIAETEKDSISELLVEREKVLDQLESLNKVRDKQIDNLTKQNNLLVRSLTKLKQ